MASAVVRPPRPTRQKNVRQKNEEDQTKKYGKEE
jgi:hypothetical protein